jgi:3-oxoadipate enol-lactonase
MLRPPSKYPPEAAAPVRIAARSLPHPEHIPTIVMTKRGAMSADAASVFDGLENHDVQTCLGRLRVRSGGSGPAIMFWSSLLMSGRMWSAQAAHFIGRHRVLLVDPPGHGDSAPLTRMFTFDECARCVAEILDALGIERTHFVGNSWGGMMGGTFAARYPQRVGQSVLMNCTASPAGLRHRIEFPLLSRLVRLLGGVRGPIVKSVITAFVGPTTLRERPQVVRTIREALRRIDVDSVGWAVNSVVPARPDQHALMAAIRTPVLVIAGVEDRTFAPSETRAMANSIPGAEFVLMPRAAHLAGLECPDEVNALIEARLGG